MANTHDLSLEELLEQATRPIDWLRIAAVDMRTNRTAFDCEARWRNLLEVRLNQGPWTSEEDERLATVAAKWKLRNWDQVRGPARFQLRHRVDNGGNKCALFCCCSEGCFRGLLRTFLKRNTLGNSVIELIVFQS